MRQLITKYDGECRKCAKPIPIGACVVYERRIGVFCPECAPTDPEEIRAYRQEGADRKADRYDEWADKREVKATAQLNSHPSIRHDIAFNTQPGHIPFRARMIAADDRAYESLRTADRFRAKASSLRNVRVAGDAESKRENERAFTRLWIEKGMRVTDCIYGAGTVTRVNQKTASVLHDRRFSDKAQAVCLSWLAPEDMKHPRFLAAVEQYKAAKASGAVE